MILVTVGSLPFTRLVRKMDEIAAQLEEEVVMQIANDSYVPENAEYFRFQSYIEMQKLCRQARLVVCHGGVGSILTALEVGAPVIAVPRSERHGEAVDDHQLELVKLLVEESKIIAVDEVDEIPRVLELESNHFAPSRLGNQLSLFLRHYIVGLQLKQTERRDRC